MRDRYLGLIGLALLALLAVCCIAHLSSRIDKLENQIKVESMMTHELVKRFAKNQNGLDEFLEKAFD